MNKRIYDLKEIQQIDDNDYLLVDRKGTDEAKKFKLSNLDNIDLINNKVDKEEGKGLSTNDFTDDYKNKLEELNITGDGHTHSNKNVLDGITATNVSNWNNKVDKINGKGLSTNDFTDEEKEKLATLKNYDDTELREDVQESINAIHTHSNKNVLDGITAEKVNSWNSESENRNSAIQTEISSHNVSISSHSDIRLLITELTTKLNNFLDVDDTTTDQLSEIIELINNNRGTIESITTNKVNVSDIINNLTTNNDKKVLSASQGVVIKGLIDNLQESINAIHTHSNKNVLDGITATNISNWNNKVDKVSGKGLSTNDFTTAEKNKLASLKNYDDTELRLRDERLQYYGDIDVVPSDESLFTVRESTTIYGYNGNEENVVIPYKINGYEMDHISQAFHDRTILKSVIIPNSVTNIDNSFISCPNLTNVIIPDSVIHIGYGAFNDCSSELRITCTVGSYADQYAKENGIEVEYNSKVTKKYVDDLKTELDNKVDKEEGKGLSTNDFTDEEKEKLAGLSNYDDTELRLRDERLKYYGDPDIEPSDFEYFQCMTIGEDVKTGSLSGINNLTGDFVIPYIYETLDGNKYIVTDISNNGFEFNNKITSIILPNTVTYIGTHAFYNCSSLEKIYIPDSVSYIGDSAFLCEGDYLLEDKELTIVCSQCSIADKYAQDNGIKVEYTNYNIVQDSLKQLKDFKVDKVYGKGLSTNDFTDEDMHKLWELKNYDDTELKNSIEEGKLRDEKLKYYGDPDTGITHKDFFIFNEDTCTITDISIYYEDYPISTVVIPYGINGYEVKRIGNSEAKIDEGVFENLTQITNVIIPNSVTEIGERAFFNCSSLTSINIPDSVTTIGRYVFSGCSGITNITIGNSVTSIGFQAFNNCSNLTSITIPDSVIEIGNYAFSGCTSLTSVTIPDSVTSIAYALFLNCSNLSTIKIPDSVVFIDTGAFCNCSNLKSVIIPNSVTSIGENVFEGCSDELVIICAEGSVADKYAQVNGIKVEYNNEVIKEYVDDLKVVKYTEQSLTDEQKAQVRANIGAGESGFSGSYNDLTNKPVIDSALSSTSTNALQNKVIKSALDGKASSSHTHSNESLGQGYGTCSTSAATVEKVVTLSSYSLTENGIVVVKFTNAVPANATMNINSKGAKAIYYKGKAIVDGVICSGEVATFIYDGTYYHVLAVDRNRFYTSLVPYGTSIEASESVPVNINTSEYQRVGNYYCSANAKAKYVTNIPKKDTAFMMQVYSPLSQTVDNETGTWVYRLRKLMYYTGEEFIQYNYTDGTGGNWKYGSWQKVIKSNDLATVATSGSYNDLSNKPTIPVIDSSLSSTSTNALQNKVIKSALDGKASSSHTHSDIYYTKTEIVNLINTAIGNAIASSY